MFIIFWVFFIGDFINMAGQQYIDVNGASGFEAFFYSNLNLIIAIGLLLSIMMYGVLS